jgi:lauroyl/myristoyl acyltransferase
MRLLISVTLILAALFFVIRRNPSRDYRNARFYKVLYTPWGFQLAIFMRRLLGLGLGKWLSASLGFGYAISHPSTLREIRRNIALLDPSRATKPHAVRLCIHQAHNFGEYADLWVNEPESILEKLSEKLGIDHIRQAHSLGKGCILVTGHLGFFELGGLVMSRMGFPITTLTLPEPSPTLTQWRADFRQRWGVNTVVVGGDAFSAVEISRVLGKGDIVALLADRPFDDNAVMVDLPHGRIPFSTAPVLLSLLSGAPIVPVGITREPAGTFRIEARPAISPRWMPEGRDATIAFYTRQLAQEHLVPMFMRHPEQWMHFARLQK